MFIEWRAHIASLVAVFLALGLGLLLGSNLSEHEQVVIRQQGAAIQALQQELGKARQDARNDPQLAALEAQLRDERRLSSALAGAYLQGKLQDVAVFVIDLGSGQVPPVSSLIASAGGQVVGTVSFTPEFLVEATQLMGKLSGPSGTLPADTVRAVARRVAEDLFNLPLGPARKDLQMLQQVGAIRWQGGAKAGSVVVVLGGPGLSESTASDIVPALITALTGQSLRVVGAQNVAAAPSVVGYFRQLNLPSVDHLDTLAGRVSLTLAIKGANGNYGNQEGDDALFPDLGGK